MRLGVSLWAAVWAVPLPALAAPSAAAPDQEAAAAPNDRSTDDSSPASGAPAFTGIVVIGSHLKIPGSVDAPQPPIDVLDEQDIASYGATSVADLLADIAPETNSGRGRGSGGPVILVNGLRIASFRELRDYPPEAIRRVEILPEEVALRYGYAPDQRVVNFILKDHFHSRTGEVEVTEPDRGGTTTERGEAGLLRIDKNRRLNITAKADRTSALTEADRGVRQVPGTGPAVPGEPDPAAFRTLVPSGSDYSLNATWTIGLGQGVRSGSLALNAAASRADTTSLSGLNSVDRMPLAQMSRTDTLNAGASLNKPIGAWQLSATLDSSHATTTTAFSAQFLGQGTDAGPRRTQSDGDSVTSLVTLIGQPVKLPAGPINVTLRAGFAYTGQTGSGALVPSGPTRLRRGNPSAGFNLAVPLTSPRQGVLGGVGEITLNLSGGLDRLSDFGSLTDWSSGITWNLTGRLGLQGSYIVKQAAPSLANLGEPAVPTYNVPVYDFTTGQSVLVTTIAGGNPALSREGEHDIKLGLNWQLPFADKGNLIVEFFDNRSSHVASSFPLLTAAVERAYQGRVTRNASGQIISIIETPVELAQQHEERLRWGFNFGGNLGRPLPMRRGRFMGGGAGPGAAAGAPGAGVFSGLGLGGERVGAARAPGGIGGGIGAGPGGEHHDDGPADGGFGRGGPAGGGGSRQRYPGRWNLSIYHTVQLVDRVLLAPGAPMLDLLNGDALANTGGVARHTLEIDGGGFYKGFGLRMGGTWTAPTRVDSSGVPGASQLRFGALFKVNLRAFVDLGQQQRLVAASSFFKGARLSLRVNNLFDSRQRVTDETGATPLAYQPGILDPLGRVLGLELRKLF